MTSFIFKLLGSKYTYIAISTVVIGLYIASLHGTIAYKNKVITNKETEIVTLNNKVDSYVKANEELAIANRNYESVNLTLLEQIKKLKDREPEVIIKYKERIVKVQQDCKEIVDGILTGELNEENKENVSTTDINPILDSLNRLYNKRN